MLDALRFLPPRCRGADAGGFQRLFERPGHRVLGRPHGIVRCSKPRIESCRTQIATQHVHNYFTTAEPKLWQVPQNNPYFRASYNKHAAAQKRAARQGYFKRAWLESNMKTKQCNLSLPIDVLMKAFRQKKRFGEVQD